MAKRKIRKIDTKTEQPIKIKAVEKKVLPGILSKRIVNNANSPYSYLLFCLEILMEKYVLDYDEVLIFLYLHELGLFELKIKILERKINLGIYLRLGYICENYSHRKQKLYKLTDKGIGVITEFYKIMNNRDSFISANRKTEIALKSKVKAVLGDYFQE